MTTRQYNLVCYRTEQREEMVQLENMRNGERGTSCGCTFEGETVQVKLASGELDSWERRDCREING